MGGSGKDAPEQLMGLGGWTKRRVTTIDPLPGPAQNMAMGLTGEPVPPTTRRGATMSMNS
jgi:hypothetical protein